MHVPVAGGRLDRRRRIVCGKVILAWKAAHVADVSQHGRRDDWPDTVDVGDRRLRRGNKLGESLLHLTAVLIDTANTSKKITSELQPSGAGTTAGSILSTTMAACPPVISSAKPPAVG